MHSLPARVTAIDPEIQAEADRLHAASSHRPGYTGPCWGPTLDDLRRAERNVKLRRAEQRTAIPPDELHKPGEHRKLHGPHRHTCVSRACCRSYPCRQRCDPDSLDDSLCPNCFQENRER